MKPEDLERLKAAQTSLYESLDRIGLLERDRAAAEEAASKAVESFQVTQQELDKAFAEAQTFAAQFNGIVNELITPPAKVAPK